VTSTADLSADLDLALQLATLGDAIAMYRFRAEDLVVETKPDLTPVSEADRAVERALRDHLSVHRPDDAILGEEYGTAGAASRTWVIDPIDGTKNYVRGVPVWAVLVALLVDGDPVVGVVSAPALGRRWWAAAGSGAWATDPSSPEPRRLRVSAVADLADASFSYSDAQGWAERGAGDGLATLLDGTWRQRAYGDFWSHMLVAEGAVDVAAEPHLETYDMAALVPVVREAGGLLTSFDGGDALVGGSALSTNGLLHAGVASLLGQGASADVTR
jgi:histidinol-phosphatase